jgi:hypothetical protein
MRHGWIALLAFLLLCAPASAQVAAGSKTQTEGQVTATLSWQKGEVFAEHPHLQIVRAGAALFDQNLEDGCKACNYLSDRDTALTIRDLDGDSEPEVLVDTFSGGAHCCTITPIYRWDGEGGVGYRRLTGFFGNVGYSLDDLDKDGRPEFVTADDSFAYEFAAYAYSAFPLLVLEYGTDRSGKTALRDVSTGYSSLIEEEVAGFRKDIPKYRKDGDPRSVIAAYVADLYRLGRKQQANTYLNSALRRGLLKSPEPGPDIWPTQRKYIRELKKFLKKHRYGV